jgi:hypothetical protein
MKRPLAISLIIVFVIALTLPFGVYNYYNQKSISCWAATVPFFKEGSTRLDLPWTDSEREAHARCMGLQLHSGLEEAVFTAGSNAPADQIIFTWFAGVSFMFHIFDR